MSVQRTVSWLPLAVVFVLALAGCGDDEDRDTGASTTEGSTTAAETGEAAAPSGAPTDVVDISETDFKLTPANPTVPVGGTVEFVVKNNGQVEHALEVEGPGGEVETESIAPGKSAKLKVKLDKAGSYTMYCPIGNHRQQGMEGKIKVAASGGGSKTPSEPKQEDTGGSSGGAGSGY